jgi:hypothetical protein
LQSTGDCCDENRAGSASRIRDPGGLGGDAMILGA